MIEESSSAKPVSQVHLCDRCLRYKKYASAADNCHRSNKVRAFSSNLGMKVMVLECPAFIPNPE